MSNWQPVVEALLDGKTVRIPDRPINQITGRLSRYQGINGEQKVNVRTTPDGVVVWLTKKEQR